MPVADHSYVIFSCNASFRNATIVWQRDKRILSGSPTAWMFVPKLIGIRNAQGEIYRVIGVSTMNQFLEMFVQLANLCLDAQIYASYNPFEQCYDAIFSTVCFTASEEKAEYSNL